MEDLKNIRIVIVKTKDFNDYNFLEEKVYEKIEKYIEENYKIIIRIRKLNNQDIFFQKFSKENNFLLEECPINWNLEKKAEFENIKDLIWEGTLSEEFLLLVFQNKWDGKNEKYIINKIIEEFKSIIDITNFNTKKYFIFEK